MPSLTFPSPSNSSAMHSRSNPITSKRGSCWASLSSKLVIQLPVDLSVPLPPFLFRTDRVRVQHLLQLFPPHTSEPPTHPSPYLYLAQINEDPNEALEYYSTATTILENSIALRQSKVRGKHLEGEDEKDEEERKMAVTALVAMIEIWMSDLWLVLHTQSFCGTPDPYKSHEEAAELHCDALISRALSLLPNDPEARLSLASIRMSQSRFDEAKVVIVSMYEDLQGKEPCRYLLFVGIFGTYDGPP